MISHEAIRTSSLSWMRYTVLDTPARTAPKGITVPETLRIPTWEPVLQEEMRRTNVMDPAARILLGMIRCRQSMMMIGIDIRKTTVPNKNLSVIPYLRNKARKIAPVTNSDAG